MMAVPGRVGTLEHQQCAVVGRHLGGVIVDVASVTQDAEAAAGLLPDLVWCSSALRTRQTWELVARSSGADPQLVLSDDVYDAGPSDLVELLRTTPVDARTVAVVGHEPSISAVSAALAALGSDPAALAQVHAGVPTAAWSVLRPYDGWSALGRGRARLVSVHRP